MLELTRDNYILNKTIIYLIYSLMHRVSILILKCFVSFYNNIFAKFNLVIFPLMFKIRLGNTFCKGTIFQINLCKHLLFVIM